MKILSDSMMAQLIESARVAGHADGLREGLALGREHGAAMGHAQGSADTSRALMAQVGRIWPPTPELALREVLAPIGEDDAPANGALSLDLAVDPLAASRASQGLV